MPNMTAAAPGTTISCPTCSATVDPYFHCCPFASDEWPYQHAERSDEQREQIARWSEHYSRDTE